MALYQYIGQLILIIVTFLALCSCCFAALCKQIDAEKSYCRCQFDDPTNNKVVDFSPISRTDGKPEFPFDAYSTAPSDWNYAFNPCHPFNGPGECKGKSVCQQSRNTPSTDVFSLGEPKPTAWTPQVDSSILVTYKSDTKTSLVTFTCDKTAVKDPVLKFVIENPTNTYQFTVNTCLACLEDVPGCPKAGGGGGNSLTTGGVLCIIFTVLVVVYISGGILFQKFGRGATGKELIPNYGFWSDFPALIKDGILFMVSPCRKDDGYSSI